MKPSRVFSNTDIGHKNTTQLIFSLSSPTPAPSSHSSIILNLPFQAQNLVPPTTKSYLAYLSLAHRKKFYSIVTICIQNRLRRNPSSLLECHISGTVECHVLIQQAARNLPRREGAAQRRPPFLSEMTPGIHH